MQGSDNDDKNKKPKNQNWTGLPVQICEPLPPFLTGNGIRAGQ